MGDKEDVQIHPTLQPESSKKFFEKDYGHDKAPERNGLHFNHPYPAVQDTAEYDSDFVKDQNSDNGEFKAQTNYDRIRAQLEKQLKESEKALEKKRAAKKRVEKT